MIQSNTATPAPVTSFGSLLRRLREEAGLTLVDVSRGVWRRPAEISAMEEERLPVSSFHIAETFARALGLRAPERQDLLEAAGWELDNKPSPPPESGPPWPHPKERGCGMLSFS